MTKVKIPYIVGNSALKPAIRLEIDQYWLYRDSKRWDWPKVPEKPKDLTEAAAHIVRQNQICLVKIVDVTTTPYGGEEIKVEFMWADEQYSPYLRHDMAWFIDQNFDDGEGYFTPFWDSADKYVYKYGGNSGQAQYGVDCVKCKTHYHYAVHSANFECWSCKNGY